MKGEKSLPEIALFAGTTEGRKLSESLASAGIEHTVCVATEYGETVLTRHPSVKIHKGRMNREEIEIFLREGQFTCVIDATHPFAREITQNIKAAVEGQNDQGRRVSYLRLKRDETGRQEGCVTYFETSKECALALEGTTGGEPFALRGAGNMRKADYCDAGAFYGKAERGAYPAISYFLFGNERKRCVRGISGKSRSGEKNRGKGFCHRTTRGRGRRIL